nr:hypothetical protein [Desulfobulbaceae bacterium]
MQDDRRDEVLNRAVEASLAIGENSLGTDTATGPWQTSTPKASVPATPAQPASASTQPAAAVSASSASASATNSGPQNPAPQNASVSDQRLGNSTVKPQGPVGIDIGTSAIVLAEGRDKKVHDIHRAKFNNTIPFESFYTNVLYEHEIPYFEMNNFDYVQGYGADNIAKAFHSHPLRPVPAEYSKGQDGVVLCEVILQAIIGRPSTPATPLYFTVPAPALENDNTKAFVKGTLKAFFSRFGYIAMPVEEGLAVVMSELHDNNYTGLVVTVGASVCNIALTYLSVPVVSFSIPKAGDYIDAMVAQTSNELQFKVKEYKENSFSLSSKPATRLERGLRIYYEDVVTAIVAGLEKALGGRPPANINSSIPVVLSGGSVQSDGFLQIFEKALASCRLPLSISGVRLAQDPVNAAAKGALIMANAEEL